MRAEALVIAEGGEGIDAHGAAGGDVTGQKGDDGHQESDAQESERIGGADAIEFAGQETREDQGSGEAEDDAGKRRPCAFLHDKPKNIATLRAESDADANFAGAL